MNLPHLFDDSGHICFYSLARYAFVDALKLAGVKAGSKVLLPEYICRDLLASLDLMGAKPVWYRVSRHLSPLEPQDIWPIGDVVLAVNYFGFPQDLRPFKDYSFRTGAKIIEDNAHGFTSQDESAKWLGCRADLGIFSMRKTVRMPDGAALWISCANDPADIPSQIPIIGNGLFPAQQIKVRIRKIPFIGEILFSATIYLSRWYRNRRSGDIVQKNHPNFEMTIPWPKVPWKLLLSNLYKFSVEKEINRRRVAYIKCAEEASRVGASPIFQVLTKNCSPYGFAFRGGDAAVDAMRKFANRSKYELVKWPELPQEISQRAPLYYLDIFFINFIY